VADNLFKPSEMLMPFGKYKGRSLGWIAKHDVRYLDWLMDADIRSPELRKAVKAMNRLYAKEIEEAVGW